MSSAISNSSARRRRTTQPKVQENARRDVPEPPKPQSPNNDYDNETIPILGVKNAIIYLSNKLHTIESYLQQKSLNHSNETQSATITTNIQDMKRTVDELSLKLDRLDLSIEKINLVLKLHDSYMNKIKTMVEFENDEQDTSVSPQLLQSNTSI